MSIDRTTILSGPGLVTYGGASLYSKGNITVDLIEELFDVDSSKFGKLDDRVSDRRIEVKFTPVGEFESLAVLFPYAATVVGTSIYGASDSALVINGVDGRKLTIHNVALTGLPDITASVSETAFGEVTFTGLLANSTAPTASAAYYTEAVETYPGDSNFDPTAILTSAFSSAWGSSPWDDFATEEGWTISFSPTFTPKVVNGCGTVDMIFSNLEVSATAKPIGPTQAELLTARKFQGTGAGLGVSKADGASDLIISATGQYFYVYGAILTESPLAWASEDNRLGDCTWKATRAMASGVAQPLFYVGTTAPS